MIWTRTNLIGCVLMGLIWLAASTKVVGEPRNSDDNTGDQGTAMSVEGLIRDVACPMQNHQSTATHFNLKCARACIKAGSPIILLSQSNEIYFPMTDQMPDSSVRQRLLPYVGKYVKATGTVYLRNGTRTIVIKEIHELKNVKLDTKLGDD